DKGLDVAGSESHGDSGAAVHTTFIYAVGRQDLVRANRHGIESEERVEPIHNGYAGLREFHVAVIDSTAGRQIEIGRTFPGYVKYGIQRESPGADRALRRAHFSQRVGIDAQVVKHEIEHQAHVVIADAAASGNVPADIGRTLRQGVQRHGGAGANITGKASLRESRNGR